MTTLTLIAAQSLDGYITRHDIPGTDFCSAEDQSAFIQSLKEFDSLIMGRSTYELSRETIRKAQVARRLRKIWTRSPELHRSDTVINSIEFTNDSPKSVLEELKRREYRRCALLGGTETYSQFLVEDLVDELWLTLEPKLFGSGKKLCRLPLDARFSLFSTDKLSPDTLLLKYKK